MKRKLTKLIAAALLLTMCLSLTGCSASLGALILMKKAYDAVNTAESVKLTASADVNAAYKKETFQIKLSGDGAFTVKPIALMLDTTMESNEFGSEKISFYAMNDGSAYSLYIGIGEGNRIAWYKTALNTSGLSIPKEAYGSIQYLMNFEGKISKGESKKINGNTANSVIIQIPGAMLMPDGASSNTAASETPIEDLQLTIWLDKKTSLPVRLEADLKSVSQYYLEQAGVPLLSKMTVQSLPVSVDLYDYNEAESIELPEKAENAKDLDSILSIVLGLLGIA